MDFERQTKGGGSGNRASLPMGAGTLTDMYRKALERGIFLHRGPVGDHGEDAHLLGL